MCEEYLFLSHQFFWSDHLCHGQLRKDQPLSERAREAVDTGASRHLFAVDGKCEGSTSVKRSHQFASNSETLNQPEPLKAQPLPQDRGS